MFSLNRSNKGYVKRKKYQELELESLRDWRWCRNLFLLLRSWKMKILNIFQLNSCQTLIIIDSNNSQHRPSKCKTAFSITFFIDHNWMEQLRSMRALRFLKPIFLSSYDSVQTLFITFITQEEFDSLQDLSLTEI